MIKSRFHTYRVVLAEHDMNKEEGPEQSIRVEKMIIHPKWDDSCVSCGYVTIPFEHVHPRSVKKRCKCPWKGANTLSFQWTTAE